MVLIPPSVVWVYGLSENSPFKDGHKAVILNKTLVMGQLAYARCCCGRSGEGRQ